ncbi:MAG: prepilin-type N-terminal cleavage/methylation domain-containing protein [Verrucomicrobiota bacterium]
MKSERSSLKGLGPFDHRDAFTLVELLTATAILSLLLMLMFQIVSEILQSTKVQNQQMESVASARRALDVMACDLQNAVVGEDVSILVPSSPGTTNLFSLMAYRRGPNGDATNRFLAINYSTNGSDQLFRSYGSVDYSQTNLIASISACVTNTPNNPIASHILGVEALAVTERTNYPLTSSVSPNWATNAYNSTNANTPDGFNALITTKPNFASSLTNRSYAMQVWIAAVDDQNYSLLTNTGKLDAVKTALSNASDPSGWRDAVDGSSIPAPAKSGIRILNKTITLP